jgi:prepilin-type N-terminal cleavage/methylation domain-containing protein
MNRRHRGFTLIELLVVMTIISILMTFILKAYWSSVRTAETKATIALITKLEQAMTDRVDALTTYRADPNATHLTLASLYNDKSRDPVTKAPIPIPSVQRAQAIAQFDYLRAQLPDVFALQVGNTNYPLNFAGSTYSTATGDLAAQLPLGNTVLTSLGGAWDGNAATQTPGTGIYGASYEIMAGIYKQLGYGPKGYDGNDNNFNGLVDERAEGNLGLSADEIALIDTRLAKHTHKTARSEMLYAILVEGGGTYGSAFDKDDFTSREVQDTDGDGLMEFVDAWGEPLQFYRWPILYRSDSQKGFPDVAKLTADTGLPAGSKPGPYSSVYETREQNPIDPNQTLVAPAWWGSGFNDAVPAVLGTNSGSISAMAMTFMAHFGPCLVDPTALNAGAASNATFWDRSAATTSGYYMRRAYYSRFLILSAGPDKNPGVARLYDPKDGALAANYQALDDRATIDTPSGPVPGPGAFTGNARDGSGAPVGLTVPTLLFESQGGKVDLNRAGLGNLSTFAAGGRNDTNSQLEYYGQDDITSQTLQSTGGALQ